MTAPEVGPTDKPTTCEHPDSWFDRTICPPPCDSMHDYCTSCGAIMDGCINVAEEGDVEFIAAARTDIPAPLDRLEQIAALHHESDGFARGFCSACGTGWPCRTSLLAAPRPVPAPVGGGQRDNE